MPEPGAEGRSLSSLHLLLLIISCLFKQSNMLILLFSSLTVISPWKQKTVEQGTRNKQDSTRAEDTTFGLLILKKAGGLGEESVNTSMHTKVLCNESIPT